MTEVATAILIKDNQIRIARRKANDNQAGFIFVFFPRRMHSTEIGTYSKEKYEALKERLKLARAEKVAREAEEKKAEETDP